MIISLIAALANNRVIGSKNLIPWRLPADLAWFKHKTLGKPIIMGRKTFESIGRPLYGRLNIVLSHQPEENQDVIWVRSITQALEKVENVPEVMIIGGGNIYTQFLPYANRMYLTHISALVDGDTYFPNYLNNTWYESFKECHESDKNNIYRYYFQILDHR